MAVEEQVAVIFAGVRGHLDKMDPANIVDFEAKFLKHLQSSQQEVLADIRSKGLITPESEAKLKDIVLKFLEGYSK